jgi:hypothetical protein
MFFFHHRAALKTTRVSPLRSNLVKLFQIPKVVNIEHPSSPFGHTLLVTVHKEVIWVVTPSRFYTVQFVRSRSI